MTLRDEFQPVRLDPNYRCGSSNAEELEGCSRGNEGNRHVSEGSGTGLFKLHYSNLIVQTSSGSICLESAFPTNRKRLAVAVQKPAPSAKGCRPSSLTCQSCICSCTSSGICGARRRRRFPRR